MARKVTDLGGGIWHYEYAVHNLNSDRAARSFSVEFPAATAVHQRRLQGHRPPLRRALRDQRLDGLHGGRHPHLVHRHLRQPTRTPTPCASRRCSTSGSTPTSRRRATSLHTLDLFKPGDPSAVEFTISNEMLDDGFETGDTSAWSGSRPCVPPHIPGQWAVVPGYGPLSRYTSRCPVIRAVTPGIRPVVPLYEPLSGDMGRCRGICAVTPGYEPLSGDTARYPGI